MKYLVGPISNDNVVVTPDGICGELECIAVTCGVLGCGRYCDCLGAVLEPWGDGETLF